MEQPLLIKIEGKSIEQKQKKKLPDRKDSITFIAEDNYDSNQKLMPKEKFKENNFMKTNKKADEIDKVDLNNKINAGNKIKGTITNDFIY